MPLTTFTNAASTSVPNNTQTKQLTSQETTTDDAKKTAGDYEDFLMLLTAQLKNQDPLQPLDSTTFVSQLAQFSNVEQQVKMNQKLDGLVASLTNSDFSEASNFLGKYVSAEGGKTYVKDSDTQTPFSYKTDENTKSVNAIITDRFGKEVKKISLPLAPNGVDWNWDLKDKQDEKIEQGLYKITIQQIDAEGKISEIPAMTKVKILQAQKTDTGFEYLTDTQEKIAGDTIKTIYAQ